MTTDNMQLYRQMKSFVLRRVKNPQDAEDIVQDVFIKIQLKAGQLREVERFTAWMYTLTRNSIMDYHRARKKVIDPVDLQVEEEYNWFNDCVNKCLDDLIQTLPSPYKDALIMAEKENIPQKELATRLGLSYSGTKSRVQRARQMLKEKMEALYRIKTDGYGNVLVCEDRLPCGCEN